MIGPDRAQIVAVSNHHSYSYETILIILYGPQSILLMSLIILHGSRLPVIRIARIAGQYAKPRSKPTEIVDYPLDEEAGQQGKTEKREVMSFRGDNVNGFEVTDRRADPERLLSYVLLTKESTRETKKLKFS
jgi:3-deoxy-D-arabino-heptulosonate 7-phosphate (DAHP) synthase class II